MKFLNREGAGKQLAKKLSAYKKKDAVVYALPRGGVVVAAPIAKALHVPLTLVITRKIGFPNSPEYALAAVSETGSLVVGDKKKLASVDQDWFISQIEQEQQEAKRRRIAYLGNNKPISATGKIAILVDDGIATGLTMESAIKVIKKQKPKAIIVAVPVVLGFPAKTITPLVDKLIALQTPDDAYSISTFYKKFDEVHDGEVIQLLK